MRGRLAGIPKLTWAAATAFAAAGLFLAWQIVRPRPTLPPPEAPAVAASPAQASPEPAQADFELQPSEDYAEVTQRPLFNRNRRPAAAAADAAGGGPGGAGGQEAPPATQLSLSGILISHDRRVALLRLDTDPKVFHVGEGQEAGGWTIETIHPDRIVARLGGESREIVLDFTGKSGNGSPAGVPPQKARPGIGHAAHPGRPVPPGKPVRAGRAPLPQEQPQEQPAEEESTD